jgi:hypothetical protein
MDDPSKINLGVPNFDRTVEDNARSFRDLATDHSDAESDRDNPEKPAIESSEAEASGLGKLPTAPLHRRTLGDSASFPSDAHGHAVRELPNSSHSASFVRPVRSLELKHSASAPPGEENSRCPTVPAGSGRSTRVGSASEPGRRSPVPDSE